MIYTVPLMLVIVQGRIRISEEGRFDQIAVLTVSTRKDRPPQTV